MDDLSILQTHKILPAFLDDGLLPSQFLFKRRNILHSSPYEISMKDLTIIFGYNKQRQSIISGFTGFRKLLLKYGFDSGFFWIGGSFVELSEKTIGRDPNDMDLVYFMNKPKNINTITEYQQYLSAIKKVFARRTIKAEYRVDCFFHDLIPIYDWYSPEAYIRKIAEWYAVFSTAREGGRMTKGFLRMDQDEPISG